MKLLWVDSAAAYKSVDTFIQMKKDKTDDVTLRSWVVVVLALYNVYTAIFAVSCSVYFSSCPISNFFSMSEWKIYVRKSANYKKSWERKYCQFFSMMKGIELQRGFPWPPHKNQNKIFLNLIRRNNSSWNYPKSHVSGRTFTTFLVVVLSCWRSPDLLSEYGPFWKCQ